MAATTKSRSTASSKAKSTKDSPAASPVAPKKNTAKAKGVEKGGIVTQLYRRFSKDTSGTYRFEAVDEKGVPIAQDDKNAHATQLYIRKTSSLFKSSNPQFLRVTIEEIDKLPKGEVSTRDEDISEDEE